MENSDLLAMLLGMLPEDMRKYGAGIVLSAVIFVATRSYKKAPSTAAVAARAISDTPAAPICSPCKVDRAAFDALVVTVAEIHGNINRHDRKLLDIAGNLREALHVVERLEESVSDLNASVERLRRR